MSHPLCPRARPRTLWRLDGTDVVFVAAEPGPKRTQQGTLALVADHSLTDVPAPAIVVVPGGPGVDAQTRDATVVDWIRQVHTTSRWTTSVCTGALLLGAAGVLAGRPATTHWLSLARLAAYGARPIQERVVEDGKLLTAAGVSAGIDMALTLVAREAGDEAAKAIQLSIEYDPQPPFATGSPLRAPAELVSRVRARAQAGLRPAAPR